MLDQRIGDFPEGGLNHAFASDQRQLLLGLGEPHARLDAAGVEDRLRNGRRELPHPRGTREEVRQGVALDPRKPVRLIRGKYAAFATPMKALAATRFCSAALMSGRRSRSRKAILAGPRGLPVGQGTASRHGLGLPSRS